MKKYYYCGNSGAGIADILRINRPKNGIFPWFEGKQIFKTFMGRVAVQRIVHLLGIGPDDDILIPSYNCGSEIDPLYKSGARISVYRVDGSARIDFNDVRRKITDRTRAIYLIHYFGFLSDAFEMANLCREKNLLLIEDCALSLFSEISGKKAGTFGDAAIFSISKTFLVRSGALVVNNEKLARDWPMRRPGRDPTGFLPLLKASFFETIERVGAPASLLKRIFLFMNRSREENNAVNSTRPPIAQRMFFRPELNDLKMMALSRFFLSGIDPKKVIEKRRRNFMLLLQNVKERPGISHFFHDLPAGVCPLYFPLVVEERSRLCKYLFGRMIETPQWWFGYHPSINWDEYPESCRLKDHVLQLPVHSRLSERAVLYIAREVNGF